MSIVAVKCPRLQGHRQRERDFFREGGAAKWRTDFLIKKVASHIACDDVVAGAGLEPATFGFFKNFISYIIYITYLPKLPIFYKNRRWNEYGKIS